MADVANTADSLSDNFKKLYADKLQFLMPKNIKLQRDIEYIGTNKRPGESYNQAVVLSHEHGYTYSPAGVDAFALRDAVPGTVANATINGAQGLLKSQIGYEAAARGSSGGPRAYEQSVGVVIENMNQTMRRRLEISYFNGQMGMGQVDAIASDVVTFTDASWAAGIWAGMEGAPVEVYDGIGATATKRVGDVTIESVDIAGKKITLSATPTSTAQDDYVFFGGQRTASVHNDMLGLHGILTASGSLFGISTADYSLWQPTSVACAGANLAFSDINGAVSVATGKGADDDLVCYTSPFSWANLLDDEVARVRRTSPGKMKYDLGAEQIEFYSQNGTIKIVPSIYVKDDLACLLPPATYKRVGATDVTFRLPDRGDEFFRHIEGVAGYELRAYVNSSLFTRAPARSILITGCA